MVQDVRRGISRVVYAFANLKRSRCGIDVVVRRSNENGARDGDG